MTGARFDAHINGMGSLGLPRGRGTVRATASEESGVSPLLVRTDEALVLSDAPPRNLLLAALPREEYQEIRPYLEPVYLTPRGSLFEQEERLHYVYFPETAVVSLVSRLRHGVTVEVGTVGYEGMAGLPLFLGDDMSSIRAFAQIPGAAQRVEAEAFVRLASAPGALHRMLLRYTQAFLTQVAQTGACNASHLVEQRCARWLLMTHDRVDGDRFPLTHEFLAFMLGVRRAGVTVAMRGLQDRALIRYTRGLVEISDRVALEGAACECYAIVRAHFDRLLPAVR